MDYAALESKLLQLATGHQLAAAITSSPSTKFPITLKTGPEQPRK